MSKEISDADVVVGMQVKALPVQLANGKIAYEFKKSVTSSKPRKPF